MISFWAVLCGSLLLALLATGSLDAFLTEPTELSGPIAKRRWRSKGVRERALCASNARRQVAKL